MNATEHSEGREPPLNAAWRLVDDAWEELKRSPYVQVQIEGELSRLPEVSLTQAQRRSKVGRELLERLSAFGNPEWPHDVALLLRLVRFRADIWSREAAWYWTVVDPLGMGFFGLFCPTAYCGGWLLNLLYGQLGSFAFRESGDTDRYLALLADYARLVTQLAERTAGQAERGIRMPKAQVLQARPLLTSLQKSTRNRLRVANHRLTPGEGQAFLDEVERRIKDCVEPAFGRALQDLSDEYLARAPEQVGMGQYPDGTGIYAELVKLHTTLPVTPEQVHELGLERMARIAESRRALRAQIDREGERVESWRARSRDEVATVFQRYMDRVAPHLAEMFGELPAAGYGVEPLPAALEGSMTFGYYEAPRRGRSRGVYNFNAAHMTTQPLLNVAALTYHELMPGHHLQFARQQENPALHPLQTYSAVNAYAEGWAEYAAGLAGECGLYRAPEERYGRLGMEAFLTSRLVVDSGMNALGWSLEHAREYLRRESGMSEAEILAESVRYSCDIPGQALAYKIGDSRFFELRERMRTMLGDQFHLPTFHEVVLGRGAMPIPDLEWHVEHEIRRLGFQRPRH